MSLLLKMKFEFVCFGCLLFSINLIGQQKSYINYKNHPYANKMVPQLIQQIDNATVQKNNQNTNNQIDIEVICKSTSTKALLADLEKLQIELSGIDTIGRIAGLTINHQDVLQIYNLPSVQYIRPPGPYALMNQGNVLSQAYTAMEVDQVASQFGLDGSGITIGVLSDSYNRSGGANADIQNGELPANGVNLLLDKNGTDEGRAMLQLIHDLASGADLAFHSALGGFSRYASGIRALRYTAGCDVIVDDLVYFLEPFYQEGVINQAVNEVVDDGAIYMAAAGNFGRFSYEGNNTFSTTNYTFANGDPNDQYQLYDFDAGPGTDYFQEITVSQGEVLGLVLQWDDYFVTLNGIRAETDLDLFVLTSDQVSAVTGGMQVDGSIFARSTLNNLQIGDPFEQIQSTNNTGQTTFYIAIGHFDGPPPSQLKYVSYRGITGINEHHTESATIIGHVNAEKTIAVGAVFFGESPAYGVNAPRLENFSSRGGTPILRDQSGNTITPILREKPAFSAIDGVNTSFFGDDINSPLDPDVHPNFFGTSAAAPHAAALAALMQERYPTATYQQILNALQLNSNSK